MGSQPDWKAYKKGQYDGKDKITCTDNRVLALKSGKRSAKNRSAKKKERREEEAQKGVQLKKQRRLLQSISDR